MLTTFGMWSPEGCSPLSPGALARFKEVSGSSSDKVLYLYSFATLRYSR